MRKTIQIKTPAPQYIVATDVSFAQRDAWCGHRVKDLRMDIIYPEQGRKKSPCIVWICGGGWLEMDTGAHLAYLSWLARQGFVVASVEYRTSNEAKFPAQLIDVKAAIRYLRAHAKRYCIDPDRFGVMGESAGGHLASMVALTGSKKAFDKGDYLEYSSAVQAACPWYPPTDITTFPIPSESATSAPESLLLGMNVSTNLEAAKKACPISYVTKQAPPFLFLHGTDDHVVPFQQSEILYDALTEKGADATLIAIDGADHADIQFFQQETWEIIANFFKEKLGK